MGKRLVALDGLRGVAILLVMGFHYFHHLESPYYKSHLYPYGERFSSIPIFQYGYIGVELFFIISGFVIALTLEASRSPVEFLIRRLIRIWPALIFSAIVTYFLLNLSNSPFALTRRQVWPNFFPSLTLTPTTLWSTIFPKAEFITGVYWSLVVEVRFYLIAAILFWLFSHKNLARNVAIFALGSYTIRAILRRIMPETIGIYDALFVPDYVPWFAAGAVFYEFYKDRLSKLLSFMMLAVMFILIVRISMNYAAIGRDPLIASTIGLSFFALFWLLITRSDLMTAFESRSLVWIGESSYSVYLFHYVIGMILISQISKSINVAFQVAMVIGISLLVLVIGRVSFVAIETPNRRWLTKYLLGSPKKSFVEPTSLTSGDA